MLSTPRRDVAMVVGLIALSLSLSVGRRADAQLRGTGSAVIDGTITNAEWIDAAEVELVVPTSLGRTVSGRLLLMHDSENLYAALVMDTRLADDSVWILTLTTATELLRADTMPSAGQEASSTTSRSPARRDASRPSTIPRAEARETEAPLDETP